MTAGVPDGVGLSEEAKAIIAEQGHKVHLRLVNLKGPDYPRTACGDGLGQWWSGVLWEVTCEACVPPQTRAVLAAVWDEAHRSLCRRHGVAPFEACRNPYGEVRP